MQQFECQTRGGRARIAADTLKILDAGCYVSPSGHRTTIDVKTALSQTILYNPLNEFEMKTSNLFRTVIGVEKASTLEVARRMCVEDKLGDVCVLNFASARNPGIFLNAFI